MGATKETAVYGEVAALTPLDRAGIWLSALAVRRHAPLDGARLADFGSGYDATIARSVLDRVDSAVLVDFSLAEDLKRHPKVHAIEGSIEETAPQLPTGSLDVILALAVLEHMWEPAAALAEFRRLLAPGGTLLVNVPSWLGKPVLEFVAFRLDIARDGIEDHKCYYDPRDLWPMLVAAGFRPSAITCRRYTFGFSTFAVCRAPEEGER